MTLVLVNPRIVGELPLVEMSDGCQHEVVMLSTSGVGTEILDLDPPLCTVVIPVSAEDLRLEASVLVKIVFFGDGLPINQDLMTLGVFLT